MQTAQEREGLLDQVVPPPPGTKRLAVIAVTMFLVAAIATTGHAVGAFNASLLYGVSDASWGAGPGGTGVESAFSLQNTRDLTVTVESIAATAPGLSRPRVTVSYGTGRGVDQRGLPTRLSNNFPIEIAIVWPQLDCSQISSGQRFGLPIHYRTELGLNGTTVVGMLWKTRTVGVTREAAIDLPGEMWAGAVTWTWTTCGR